MGNKSLAEWLALGVASVVMLLMLSYVIHSSGQVSQHVTDLSALEQETKADVQLLRAEVHEVAVKVARIEGYLQTKEGITVVME